LKNFYSEETNFFGKTNPEELIKKYGSPLYVYNEKIFRTRCREMKNLIDYEKFTSNFSIKANSSLELLKIANDEGLYADAMSPGEIFVLKLAGFMKEKLFYVSNNATEEELKAVADEQVIISIDSLSQLETFGKLKPGAEVSIRVNTGIGAGHHEKVITAGKNTKFGINMDGVDEVKSICKKYGMKVIGINQHIGSLFMEPAPYIEAAKNLLLIAEKFDTLKLIDFGGGFGIPYKKQEGQARLDLKELSDLLTPVVKEWALKNGQDITFKAEPGRYISAEAGVLLGKVNAVKFNGEKKYIGTDIGFNVLIRPAMYDSWHELEFYKNGVLIKDEDNEEVATLVGNICETGDILANDRKMPKAEVGDICGVMDEGAYGMVMSSNYNNRLRPAEVLICEDGSDRLIRRRDTFEDLVRAYETL